MSLLKELNILLVEDNDEHAYIISRYLSRAKDAPTIKVSRVDRLGLALSQCKDFHFDVMFLDLRLPDSDLQETLPRVLSHFPDIPVIILSSLEDREFALQKVHEGAQDYICKSELSSEYLVRASYAAIERKSGEVLLRKQIQRMRLLFEFSKYAMSEEFAEHIVDHLRKSAMHGTDASAVEVVRFQSEPKDQWLRFSGLWNLAQPVVLGSDEMKLKIPSALGFDGYKQCMVVPVRAYYRDEIFALIFVLSKNVRDLSEEESQFLQSLANTLGIALSRSLFHQELKQRIDQLNLANKQKDNFLATLSHELRTPLNIIKGGLDLLRNLDSSCQEYQDIYERIERNLSLEIQLVKDTLDLSRMTTGDLKLNVSEVDVRGVLESVLDGLSDSFSLKSLNLHFDCDSDSLKGYWDYDRIRQIIGSILSNAIKFTPEGGHIWVRARMRLGFLEIEVQDSGLGIAPDNHLYIFQKFWQADSGKSRKGMGLGLGLSIVKHLVELHGGSVEVESEGVGKGSLFRVKLPFNKSASAVRPPPSKEAAPVFGKSQNSSLKGIRVFLLDDSEDTLVLMKRLLEKQGALVTECSLPVKALKMLKEGDYDLLVSDIGMPELDGYELLSSFRSWEKEERGGHELPAIALSAYTAVEDIQKAKEVGFQAHLGKPASIPYLCEEILSLTGKNNESIVG